MLTSEKRCGSGGLRQKTTVQSLQMDKLIIHKIHGVIKNF